MTIRIEVAGKQYGGFTSASVELRLDAFSSAFSLECSSEEGRPLPFLGGEACRIFVDGEKVLTGWIEVVNVDGDAASHRIAVRGRDRTSDLVDSTLGAISDLRPPIGLAAVARRVAQHVGSSIGVSDQASPEPFQSAEDLLAPEPGKPALEFLDGLARKRQVLLTSDGEGRLVLARPTGRRVRGAGLIHRPGDPTNNVLKYTVSYDQTGRFRVYRCLAQLNPAALAAAQSDAALEAIVNQGGSAVVTDGAIRRGRQLVVASEAAYSSAEADKRARWEANIRRARGRAYGATVDGFRNQAGELWAPNTRVRVDDAYAGINSVMLVNSVTFGLTEGDGSTTTLSLVERDAYTLELSEPREDELELGIGLADEGGA